MDICMHICGYVSVGSEIALLVVRPLVVPMRNILQDGYKRAGSQSRSNSGNSSKRVARWCEVMQSLLFIPGRSGGDLKIVLIPRGTGQGFEKDF